MDNNYLLETKNLAFEFKDQVVLANAFATPSYLVLL
jgi:hypothetical protein